MHVFLREIHITFLLTIDQKCNILISLKKRKNGGIYLDTDVEVVKNLDPLLDNEAYMGFEDDKYINTGSGFGAVKGHQFLLENMHYPTPKRLKYH